MDRKRTMAQAATPIDAHPPSDPVIRVIVGGQAYKTVHWSPTTIVIDAYDGTLRPGDRMTIDAVAPINGAAISVDIQARVAHYVSRKWRLEAVLVDLDGHGLDVLRSLRAGDAAAEPVARRLAG